MNFTEDDIKKAFRLGWNSTGKYAKQKGYPTNQDECVKYLLKEKGSEKSSVISPIISESDNTKVNLAPEDFTDHLDLRQDVDDNERTAVCYNCGQNEI